MNPDHLGTRPAAREAGGQGAQALAELLNQLGGEVRDTVITLAEEHFERRLTEATSGLETRLPDQMSQLEIRLDERMRKLESRLLGWAFAFWLGQFAVLIGSSSLSSGTDGCQHRCGSRLAS